jgi:hypothetical protein
VLLSDAKVSSFLAEHFVLYWSTVRPAPKVTIDFGNGHLLERTLKGNTIFYVVRSDGRVVDAVPGVYLPDAFLSELNQSLELLALSDAEVLERHATEAVTLRFQAVGMNSASAVATLSKAPVQGPLIRAIEPTTVSKAVLQSPMIAGLEDPHPATTETPSIVDVSSLPLTTDELEEAYLPGPGTLAERALEGRLGKQRQGPSPRGPSLVCRALEPAGAGRLPIAHLQGHPEGRHRRPVPRSEGRRYARHRLARRGLEAASSRTRGADCSLRKANARAMDLRVLTFNIRYDTPKDGPNAWEFRREMALEMVASVGCHIVGFQEVLARQRADLEAGLEGLQLGRPGARRRWRRRAVLSGRPVQPGGSRLGNILVVPHAGSSGQPGLGCATDPYLHLGQAGPGRQRIHRLQTATGIIVARSRGRKARACFSTA